MRRRLNGEGTVYEEHDPRRRTTHRAEIDVRLPTGQVYRVTARGVGAKDARAKLASKVRRLKESHPDAERMTVAFFLDKWLDFKAPRVRASTLETYRRDVRHVKERIGDVRLSRLTPRDTQMVVTAIQSDGWTAQAEKVRRTLKQALRQAVKWELLTRNPAEHLEPLERDETKRSVLTPAQVVLLLDAMRGLTYHALIALAIHSGLRIGELLALRWRDITDDSVVVRRTLSEGAPTGYAPPKTKAGFREVPVAPEVLALLGKRRRSDDLVFVTGAGTPMTPRLAKRALDAGVAKANKAVKRWEIMDPLPEVRLHDLRRTFATLQAASGTHPRVIQKLLGHATPDVSMAVYTDVLAEQIEKARLPSVGV